MIESESTETSLIRVIAGLHWLFDRFAGPENAVKPGVLNLSLGFPSTSPPDVAPDDFENVLSVMRRVLGDFLRANVLPVVAIGNDGPGTYGYPGGFSELVSVGAVDFSLQPASFSGGGTPPGESVRPDLMGFGVDVSSSLDRDYSGVSRYERASGTSMATPYVSGIASLYRCLHPSMPVGAVRAELVRKALGLGGAPDRVGHCLARFLP